MSEERILLFGLTAWEVWTLIGPLVSAILAAVLALLLHRSKAQADHRLSLDYEAEIASRNVRREKLLMAYEWIDAAEPGRLQLLSLPPDEAFERTKLAGKGMGLVKLFGSEQLSIGVDQYIEMLNGNGSFNSDEFMNLFRDELREGYGLGKTNSRYKWLDFKKLEPEHTAEKEE